ncbi:MAG: response regulator transcription factor [Acidimicrobiales bacterium]
MAAARILVVDDEPMVREVLTAYLTRDGHQVAEAGDGAEALRQFDRQVPDLVVLDVMLPETDGLAVLRAIRSRSPSSGGQVPVVLLTARVEELDRVLGLELGADDYVVKPFSPRELAIRVRKLLDRSRWVAGPDAGTDRLDFADLALDLRAREVRVRGELVALTPKEFDLLVTLAGAPRQVFSRAQLLEQVWDSTPDYQDPATVTVHVGRLRQKLELDPNHPRWISTVWGVGYRFEP